MRSTLTLFAAVLVTLAVAPTAHARWITGNANPPVHTDDNPCRNGMAWSYLTFTPGLASPPWAPPREIRAHAVVFDRGGQPAFPPPSLDVVAWANTRTIPRRTRTLPSSFNQISQATFAPRPLNQFDFSADFAITFKLTLFPGQPLRMLWVEPPFINTPPLISPVRYRVQNCWLGTVVSRRQILVGTVDPALALGQLQPRQWFLVEGGVVIVADEDHEVGENLLLKPWLE